MFRRTILCVFALALLTLGGQVASAQSDEKKFEAGGQVTFLRVPTFSTTFTGGSVTFNEDRVTNWGFGGRIGYNFSRNVGIEGELNFFPEDDVLEGGRKLQGFVGVKAGQRFEKVGVFAKARPGFVRFSRGDHEFAGGCIAVFPPPIGCFDPVAKTNWAADVGGIVEVYPSDNTIVRFDIGDTIIRYDDRIVATTNNGVFVAGLPQARRTKHHLQASVGLGIRF